MERGDVCILVESVDNFAAMESIVSRLGISVGTSI